jgi:hypothetical protein
MEKNYGDQSKELGTHGEINHLDELTITSETSMLTKYPEARSKLKREAMEAMENDKERWTKRPKRED